MKTMCKNAWNMWMAVIVLLVTLVGDPSGIITASATEYGSYTVNLAQGKTAYASSNQRGDGTVGQRQVSFLTDGNTSTFIILHQNDPDPYVYTDLASAYSVNKVTVVQGANSTYPNAYATKFAVEYTTDLNTGWKCAATMTGAESGENTVLFAPVTARYIRIHVLDKYAANASFLELMVYETNTGNSQRNISAYGSYNTNLVQGKKAYASSNQRGDSTVGERQISFLTDGSVDNFILLHQSDEDPYVYADLGSSYSVNKVEVYQGANSDYPISYAKRFAVEYTDDLNHGWQKAAIVTEGNSGKNTVTFAPVTARYIRIHVLEKYAGYASFRELKVYETNYNTGTETITNPTRILFIGNSLTHYNDVAIKVRDLFAATGQEVDVDTLIQLGKPLTLHMTLPETSASILDGNYDYVIMQDKATNFDGDGLMTGVQTIYGWIAQTHAKPVLYMPWANESVLQNRQSYFTSSYVAAARAIGAQLAPAGEAWYELYYHYGYNWYADNTHANNTGSLVSAATIFYTLTGRTTPLTFAASDSIVTKNEVDVNVMNLIQERCCIYANAYRNLNHIQAVTPGGAIQTGSQAELAQGKKAYASSNQRGDGTVGLRQVSFLTDGNDSSFIILNQNDPDPYVYVDLGSLYNVDKVVVNQGANSTYPNAYATRFAVEYTNDLDDGWKTAVTVNGDQGENVVTFAPVTARYIRIHVFSKYSSYASFLELKVYESDQVWNVYFDKPSNWGNTIYAYVYGDSGSASQNAPWPGVAMTKGADGRYQMALDDGYAGAYVIFNDGTNQAPASMQPGYTVVAGGSYTVNGYSGK